MRSGLPDSGKSSRKLLLHAPAVQALFVQCMALVLAMALVALLSRFPGFEPSAITTALLQGAIAAGLSRARSMAPWWLGIQFLFPVAAVLVQGFQLPPWLFLAGFVALLALYWTTFRTQVPFYPSSLQTWNAVAALLPQSEGVRFVDIGSGFGGLVMHLAQSRRDSVFSGIEIAPLPWLASVLRASVARSGTRFLWGDYGRLDFSGYDVVFAYLSPAAMPTLWHKAKREMNSGTLLLSYEFPIPGIAPDLSVRPAANGPLLFGWRM